MRYLVTGAPGWLCNRLVEVMCLEKMDVTCLVLKGMSVDHLKKMGAKIIYGNVLNFESLLIATKNIDRVIHAVGVIHPKRSKDFYNLNTNGTKNILKASCQNGVKKFLYISSNSAQGYNIYKDKPMTEKDKDRPYTDYGKSKWNAEQIVKEYQKSEKIKTIIIRPCWFYGPNPGVIFVDLVKRIKNGKPPIFGNGLNLRTMSYIDNTVYGVIKSIESDNTTGQTYWFGDEKPYKLIDIYNEIAKNLNVNIHPIHVPWFICVLAEKIDQFTGKLGQYHRYMHVLGETGHYIWCDTSKAQKDFGYEPKISLKEGMKKTIDSMKSLGLLNEK
jgi:nucleoside-diphosphate-sugar epimerase